jgi:hypothetical protein
MTALALEAGSVWFRHPEESRRLVSKAGPQYGRSSLSFETPALKSATADLSE